MSIIPLALSALKSHWRLIALALLLAALGVQTLRLSASRAAHDREIAGRALDRAGYEHAQVEAANMAMFQRAKDEAEYQEKADAADKQIAGLRDDLRARLMRAEAVKRASGGAAAKAEGGGAGLSESLPAPAPVDSGSVQVDADILAGLAAYAIQAHDWALSLND